MERSAIGRPAFDDRPITTSSPLTSWVSTRPSAITTCSVSFSTEPPVRNRNAFAFYPKPVAAARLPRVPDLAFHRDPYLAELETEVVEVGEADGRPWAITADTVFYPEGGGQPADHGVMGAARVVDVHRRDGRVVHLLTEPIHPGPIHQRLDWRRRFDHMQQHSAQHLLTAVADVWFGWPTTAFHLGDEVCDIELDVPSVEVPRLAELEEAVAREIREARPIDHGADPRRPERAGGRGPRPRAAGRARRAVAGDRDRGARPQRVRRHPPAVDVRDRLPGAARNRADAWRNAAAVGGG